MKNDVVQERERHTSGKIRAKSQELRAKAERPVSVHGHGMRAADVFKFGGLVAFVALMALACYFAWPYIHDLFEPGGYQRVVDRVQTAGPAGALILLGIQFLQMVVAFIPGEVVQIAAGLIYGPWIGAFIILLGCVISSMFIFWLVRKFGAPFVQQMVSGRFIDRFERFESTGKLKTLVFVLFLVPGLPKDVFTYLVPLTNMDMRTFVVLSTIARIPGVVVSTYAANGFMEGRIVESVVIFLITAVVALGGLLLQRPFFAWVDEHSHKK